MNGVTLIFTVVSHDDTAFSHRLEVGLLTSEFILPSVMGIFLTHDEDLGFSR